MTRRSALTGLMGATVLLANSAKSTSISIGTPVTNATDTPLLTLLGPTADIKSLAASPDGTKLLAASGDTAWVWDGATGEALASLSSAGGKIQSATFSADGSRVLGCFWSPYAKVWDVSTKAELATLSGHTSHVAGGVYSADGSKIVTWSADGSAIVWDAQTGQVLATAKGGVDIIYGAAFSPDGKLFGIVGSPAAYGAPGVLELWDVASGSKLQGLAADTAKDLRDLAFSSDGKIVFSGGSPKKGTKIADVYAWATDTGGLAGVMSGHTGTIFSVTVSPDQKAILTGSNDGTARVFDVASRSPTLTLSGHAGGVISARYSPDGSRIVTAGTLTGKSNDGTARVWDAQAGTALGVVNADSLYLEGAVFLEGGESFATGGGDGKVRVWATPKAP